MSQFAYVLVGLAVAAAFACWIAGVVFYVRTLREISGQPEARTNILRAIVAWPFAVRPLQGNAAANAAKVNKALVAFIACVIIAVAAISVATNLARMSR